MLIFAFFKFPFLRLYEIGYCVYVYLKEKKTAKSENLEMLPSW